MDQVFEHLGKIDFKLKTKLRYDTVDQLIFFVGKKLNVKNLTHVYCIFKKGELFSSLYCMSVVTKCIQELLMTLALVQMVTDTSSFGDIL
jgi:hypothetical protein